MTYAVDAGIPELAADVPVVLFSKMGGLPAPGFPPVVPIPRTGGPVDEFIPVLITKKPFWAPVVDPEGDVFIPLRDSWAVGGGSKGSYFLHGDYRFVPRAYLLRGATSRGFISEADEGTSNFESSLQSILNAGAPDACVTTACRFPPHVNFNSFFVDVNSDGLPDLVAAEAPLSGGDHMGSKLTCLDGHRVYLNRGYGFELVSSETLPASFPTWSRPDDTSTAYR